MTTLRDADVIADYARGAREIYVEWQDKMPAHNQGAVAQLIRTAVRSSAMPDIEFNFKTFSDGSGGALNSGSWMLDINRGYTDKHALEEYLFKWLCGILYHESRHAEQYFYCAQAVFAGDANLTVALSGSGTNAQQIGRAMNLPDKVANAAENTRSYRLLSQAEKNTVLSWFNSVWGTQAGHRAQVYTMPNLFTPGSPGNTAYINLPEEVDAYATQAEVEAAVGQELAARVQRAVQQRQDFGATKSAVAAKLVLAPPGGAKPAAAAKPAIATPAAVTPVVQPAVQQAAPGKGMLKSLQGLFGRKKH